MTACDRARLLTYLHLETILRLRLDDAGLSELLARLEVMRPGQLMRCQQRHGQKRRSPGAR